MYFVYFNGTSSGDFFNIPKMESMDFSLLGIICTFLGPFFVFILKSSRIEFFFWLNLILSHCLDSFLILFVISPKIYSVFGLLEFQILLKFCC